MPSCARAAGFYTDPMTPDDSANLSPPSRRTWLLSAATLAITTGSTTSRAKDKRTFKFVYADNFPPLSYLDNGVLRGTSPRIVEELFNKRLQLGVTHHAYPWARAQSMVEHGEADGFVSAATPARLEYTVASTEPLLQARLSAYARVDHPQFAKYLKFQANTDLAGLKLGSILGNNWTKATLGSQHVEYVRDRELAFRMLLAGRFDVFVEVEDLAEPALKALGLDDDIKAIPLVLALDDVKVCLGKRSPLVGRMREIDETIRAMRKDGTMARLRKP